MKSRQIVLRVLMLAGVTVALSAASCLDSQTALFTPESNSHTFVFDSNNSLKITTEVNIPFSVTVEQWDITQEEYQETRRSPNFPASECWETGGPGHCIFYRVISSAQQGVNYTGDVHYIIGFTTPAVKFNKHDLMLLVSEEDDGLFDEEITTKVIRNYQVGDDPGVSGDRGGFSDYIVAKEVVRPVAKKK